MRVLKAGYEIINKDSINGLEILKTIERVGRTCYKSEDKTTDDSAVKFVRNLINRGHEAMIEFANITVKFTCNRGISHEIVRHRVSSFAQESTRYVNYSSDKNDNQVKFIDIKEGIALDTKMQNMDANTISLIVDEWNKACEDSEKHYLRMIELGATPQIARSVLNSSTKTEINMSANLREWRHFFKLRADKPAHPQMREITIPLLLELNELIPVVFEDIVEDFTNKGIIVK